MAKISRSLKNKLERMSIGENTNFKKRQTGAMVKGQSGLVILDDGCEYTTNCHDLNDRDYYNNFNRSLLK